ncbi:MAG: ATP-binding protein [Lactobacillales bacterium]|jgi:predicted AAA+ superfamily ATPase|nr:ATP-binding protein [Lactobacillales bacterium]
MIVRSNYIEKILKTKEKKIIKVLTGVRRCGKSTILTMFQNELKAQGVKEEQIQGYNFEDLAFNDLLNYHSLYDRITSTLIEGKMNYIFLDEIQLVPEFEKAIDSLFIKENVDLYITGSNATMLSGELATLLSGRTIEIQVYPLSFEEFYRNHEDDKYQAFQHYLDNGGFPFTTEIQDEETYKDYVNGIVNTVLVKDVLSRKKRSDTILVEQIARFLTDITGNFVTIKKIADTLTSLGQKTTSETVLSYIASFQEAFLFYRTDRYDVIGKRYLSINSKYYPVDQALRRALLGSKRPNLGNRLENIVYMELRRRGYEIYVGNVGELEVDFVTIKDGITEYYQVSLTVANDKTYTREALPLKAIKDNYRKILLTQDLGNYNDAGIEQVNVVDWLLGKFG